MNIKTGIDYLSEGIALLTCLGKDQPLKKYIDNYLYEANLDKKAFYEERKDALDFLFDKPHPLISLTDRKSLCRPSDNRVIYSIVIYRLRDE